MEKIKSYYNKDKFDYTQGDVDPFEYHRSFYLLMNWFGVLDTEPPSRFSIISRIYMAITTTFNISLCILSVSHGVTLREIPHITEAGTYLIVLMYKLMILASSRTDAEHFHALLRIMKEDFHYICTKGALYRTKFFENQLITWHMSIKITIFINFISIGMIIFAIACLIFYCITYKEGQNKNRPLLFPFWAPNVDLYASPLYEIIFVYSNFSVFLYGYNYLFMLLTQIVWIRHITTKADLVMWSLQDLFDKVQPSKNLEEANYYAQLIKSKMGEIIKQHQSMYTLMDHYSSVYRKFLMFEQKMCGPVVCLTAFCAVEKFEEGELQVILILLCIATTVNYFIPSYLCTFLGMKVTALCDACWGSKFWNAPGSVVRPYLVLIMQRSLRPLPLQEAGFEEVSLKTFSSKMTSAYSCFNMLRQTK